MFITLRNLVVHIMAAFIHDREKRRNFRNKYKIKSKFRKLRDDNRKLFNEIISLRKDLAIFKEKYDQHLLEWEREKYFTFDNIKPLDSAHAKGPNTEVFLAIACVAKNEGPYLKEWIEYHRIVGVDRFYFYDNESDDDTREILDPYIRDGIVIYHFLPNHKVTKKRPQIHAYNDAIFKYRERTRWMAIIDIDEFIVPVEKNTIPEFLADYEKYPGVVINWVCFDSNGYEKKPTEHGGLLTANYTRVRKNHNNNSGYKDTTVKSIVNPKVVASIIQVHYGLYFLNNEAVTENFQRTRGQETKFHSSKKIRINHYYTKSREEYVAKIKRNSKASQSLYKFDEARLNFQDETIEDLVIQKYVPKLKSALYITD